MRLLATLLLLLLATTTTHAADPAQPKVGPTTVINATNGYGGVLTVRTQLNVGYAGQQGYVDIQSTNGTYTTTLTVDASGYTDMVNTGTNVVQVGQRGELFVGNQGVPEWGGLSQLTVENDVSTGDPVLQRVNFESIGDSGLADYAGSYFKADSTTTAVYSQLLMEAKEADTTSDATLVLSSGHGNLLYMTMTESGTNYVAMEPGVGDGATPYAWNTSVPHTTGSLATWGNDSTNILTLGAKGGLWLGRDALNEWSNKDFVIEQNIALGDADPLQIYWESISSADYFENAGMYTFLSGASNSVTARILLQTVDLGTSPVSRSAQLQSAYDELSLRLTDSATARTLLFPSATDGNPVAVFDSTAAHTTGDLLQVKNHGTIAERIWYDGTVSAGNAFATGAGGWLPDPDGGSTFKFAVYANGIASMAQLQVNNGTSGNILQIDPEHVSSQRDLFVYSAATNKVEFGNGVTKSAQFDADSTANETRLLLWDVTANALVRVSRGASDSGGSGFRLLRIPN